jgi:hypothetical protein
MRRCELAGARRDLLDLAAGTLEIDVTRVVVDGQVIESDGKTENAQHLLLPGAEDADEGGVHDADGESGESGGLVGQVSATSARCRD